MRDEPPACGITKKCGIGCVAITSNVAGKYQIAAAVIVEIPSIFITADVLAVVVIVDLVVQHLHRQPGTVPNTNTADVVRLRRYSR